MELDRPLREAGGAAAPAGEGAGPPAGPQPAGGRLGLARQAAWLLLDAALSAALWCLVCFVDWSPAGALSFFVALVASMAIWRRRLLRRLPGTPAESIPYTCGVLAVSGKELFLVATMHISPRAPRDVEAVVEAARPDAVLIELDEERLDDMREAETPQDLQPFEAVEEGAPPYSMLAQRASWNAEQSGERISGSILYDDGNPYGLNSWCEEVRGGIALVRRGGPEAAGHLATFSAKAHRAAAAGASALLVVNSEAELPAYRIGTGSLLSDLRVAMHTRNCSFPPVPVLLLPRESGEQLREWCLGRGIGRVTGTFEVLPDSYPRRTLRRRLCQACALTISGIGALYCIIECLAVDVGGEFMMAEAAAAARGIQCTCIDVDMDGLCSRVRSAILPTPWNLARALRAWLALPRILARALFPSHFDIDVIGGAVLHMLSFHVRTWVAIALAASCAGAIAGGLLTLLGHSVASAAQGSGVVSDEDSGALQAFVMLFLEMYMMARLYDAVAASRDEAMYRGIVARAREGGCQRLVAVVGAAHANGILRHVREGGL